MRRATVAMSCCLLVALSGCGQAASQGTSGQAAAQSPSEAGTVTVQTNLGEVEVPRNPQRVVALDNTSFETLQAFGITPVAAPKQLLPQNMNTWADDGDILDVGTHREPKLEVIAQAKPDLIIGGKRFAKVTSELQKLAPVVDLAPSTEKDGYVDTLKKQTSALGDIFDKKAEADALNAGLDQAVAAAAEVSDGKTAFLANHSGGKIDNGAGRIGALLQPLNMTDVFATEANSESVHQDSGLAPETVAQANPDVMIVMDRDAATAEAGEQVTPANKTVEAQKAWANTTFVKNDAIVYLADTFYVTEGIQAYTDAYTTIAEVLGGSAS